jgi:hypothetical protein
MTCTLRAPDALTSIQTPEGRHRCLKFSGITLPDWDYTAMMRNSWPIFGLCLALLAGCAGRDTELLGEPEPAQPETYVEPEQQVADQEPWVGTPADSLAMFDDLRFYGSWYELYPYGMVWRPVVVSDWSPMTYGHWVWSSYGWMWVSYDPFGWAVYNYGYWVYDFALGWAWVPGYVWAPAQCEWTWWDDTIGWAPLPPPGNYYQDPWDQGDINPWITVPIAKFKSTDVGRYRVEPRYKSGTSDRTLHRTAPDVSVVERGSGRMIKPIDVRLDQSVVGGRQYTRVVLPTDQQSIVDDRRAEARHKTPAPAPGGSSNGSGDSGSNVDDSQSKQKPSPPAAKKESPPKFKEKVKEPEKSKDGDTKDGGKSKGR